MSDNDSEGTTPVGSGDYVVKLGDSMGSIAYAHGHFWMTLWELPENSALKEARKHPHILLPGDRITIPPLRQRSAACQTGKLHQFRRRGVPAKIRFTFRDSEGKPIAGKKYELVAGASKYSGMTPDDGTIEHFVDPAERAGVITIWPELANYPESAQFQLRIGELAPVETLRGARARLNGLGFVCGDENAEPDATFSAVVSAFQKSQSLPETGTLDDATRDALRTAFGS